MADTGVIRDASANKGGFKLTGQKVSAYIFLALLGGGFYYVMHQLHNADKVHHGLMALLPIPAIGFVALVIPVLMLLSMPDDFKRLYPTNPDHYIKICKKAYSALGKNNFKVSEKTM